MDPCPFIRILVGNLALKLPPSDHHPTSFCRINVKGLPPKESLIFVLSREAQLASAAVTGTSTALAATFSLDKSLVERLVVSQKGYVKVEVYKGRRGWLGSYGFGGTRKFLGKVSVPLDLKKPAGELKGRWVDFGRKCHGGGEVHVNMWPEHRFEKDEWGTEGETKMNKDVL